MNHAQCLLLHVQSFETRLTTLHCSDFISEHICSVSRIILASSEGELGGVVHWLGRVAIDGHESRVQGRRDHRISPGGLLIEDLRLLLVAIEGVGSGVGVGHTELVHLVVGVGHSGSIHVAIATATKDISASSNALSLQAMVIFLSSKHSVRQLLRRGGGGVQARIRVRVHRPEGDTIADIESAKEGSSIYHFIEFS
ncbi:hypothetical protein LZ31DRAFT_125111 [Colletotrichum somersetense]|nr:hypothetical protein LZ31DRAFT_125111 [Colletotrichum somersetense]